MTDPGRLNRRLVLEAPDETPDGAGGVERGYTAVATLWASVEAVSARGGVVADAAGATITHRIVTRFRTDVTTRHRLREGERIFRIVAVRETDRRFLDIGAEERTD